MSKYEVVDTITGELIEFETKVDIDLLEEYNRWVVNNKLNPPTYSPKEYAVYLEAETMKKQVAKAVEMIEYYLQSGTVWAPEMVEKLLRILKDEE
jgi:hypothetical protein